MTPKEFTDTYPTGTNFVIKTGDYDLNGHYKNIDGIHTYMGIRPCSHSFCDCRKKNTCSGHIVFKDENGRERSDCFSFNCDDLNHEMPLALDNPIITITLPEDLFEI